ncbi:hypothetical protein D6783_00490 [Candidatus Woesearchaeota archaeon]|nr:MAG: hypothetical protein D6783_00490 [Candidatus Woesearchaeota archaeon]
MGGVKLTKQESPLGRLEKEFKKLSQQEIKELLLVNTYKMAMLKAQVEAITQILIKKKITTYEEVWNLTNDIFKDSKL